MTKTDRERRTELDALCTRFAHRVTTHLGEQSGKLPPHVGERLRLARAQALRRARLAGQVAPAKATALVAQSAGAGAPGRPSGSRWWSLVAALPLVVLVVGLALIQQYHERAQINAAADVDAALLSDNLPPAAYRDPGFLEFLKRSNP